MDAPIKRKRKPSAPTGNAGEYFVMGELLRRHFDAQLADRNTKGYDLLVGGTNDKSLRKVQVKTSRSSRKAPQWYIKLAAFEGEHLDGVTVYVLLGSPEEGRPIRYFIAKNRDVLENIKHQKGWTKNAFMSMKAVQQYENCWDNLRIYSD